MMMMVNYDDNDDDADDDDGDDILLGTPHESHGNPIRKPIGILLGIQ